MKNVETKSYANPKVLEFYKTLPFNFEETLEQSIEQVKRNDPKYIYPPLVPYLKAGISVLEVGSGVGWFSNAIAYFHQCEVWGIDYNPVAIDKSNETARAMGLSTRFETHDLFLFNPKEKFDVVVSIGVLHHTDNCLAAIERVFRDFVKPGGHVFIGLYHTYGRQPLLNHFRAMQDAGASEDRMFERYRILHNKLEDDTHARSWFRDQVLHPQETQHTLEEVYPIMEQCGMNLITTSINRYQPFSSPQELFDEEKKYYSIGVQRLSENKYFTGFFVFLAEKLIKSEKKPKQAGQIDTKPYIAYHPLFGYHYIPSTCLTLPAPMGTNYSISINSEGIRSNREYSKKIPSGCCRIIVFGDSMPAGQYVNNELRFSELLERKNPNLEVINFALEGSGSDQQLLIYEHLGMEYEHDAVVFMPFLQNIRRNMVENRLSYDPQTGEPVYLPKPRYVLEDGELTLTNVPVPRERIRANEIPDDSQSITDHDTSFKSGVKAKLNRLILKTRMKKILYQCFPREPFPEYRDAHSPEWKLMEAIVRRFKELAADKPLFVVPTFYSTYTVYRMAMNYLDRYQSIREDGIITIDILPYFRKLGDSAPNCFNEPYDCHFSKLGHLVLASALETEFKRHSLI